ncbi:MAG: C-type lectin domain-containing protein [Flavobacteriaceae bacterium]|nr:C-type lectin domain-containing protein [Flavobacteriaceae bacterium]
MENSDAELIFIDKPDYPTDFYFIAKNNKLGEVIKYGQELFLSHNTSNAGRIKLRIKQGTNNDKKNGSVVFYKDKIKLVNENNNTECVPHRAKGQKCSTVYPTFIEDGNYVIEEIKVRCDDSFEMYIDGKTYSGSGWNRVFTFNNLPTKSNAGFNIGFRCYNGGGPGGLIAQIKLTNGSIIVTDNTWRAKTSLSNLNYFKKYIDTYTLADWVLPNIIGLNQNGKKRFDGRINNGWDRSYTDANFSKYANWIWAGPCTAPKVHVYLAKKIGDPPGDDACAHNLTNFQATCYLQRYADIRNWAVQLSTRYKKTYKFNSRRLTWYQHNFLAKKRGMQLACFNNANESNLGHRYTNGYYYIGGIRKYGLQPDRRKRYGHWWRRRTRTIRDSRTYNRTSSTWRWIDGSQWNYQNFVPNYEPNNYRNNNETVICVYPNKQWNDINPGTKLQALYQKNVRLRPKLIKLIYWAKYHWKVYGCHEGRTYECLKPPTTVGNFDYQGCYLNDYNKNIITTNRGKVNTFQECANKAERNRDRVFGLLKRGECYTSNDYQKATKNPNASECFQKGGPGRGKFQVFYRNKPYDPLQPNLSNLNFVNKPTEQFSNQSSNSSKFNKNNIILMIVLLLIVFLVIYCFRTN